MPRKGLWSASRSHGVYKWYVRVIQGMYVNVRSRVHVNGHYSNEFGVDDAVCQGSVLSRLLFVLLLVVLSREFHTAVPCELLYANDLLVTKDCLEECFSKLQVCKARMENKRLTVNMNLICCLALNLLQHLDDFPCAISRNGVGVNSIECSQCKLWAHKKCSGLTGRLVANQEFVRQRCRGVACSIDGRPVIHVGVDGTN